MDFVIILTLFFILFIFRTLSDVDKDGKLNCDEFCIAMHLIDIVRMGQVLPAKLPPELIPGKSRAGSFGSAPSSMPQPGKHYFFCYVCVKPSTTRYFHADGFLLLKCLFLFVCLVNKSHHSSA